MKNFLLFISLLFIAPIISSAKLKPKEAKTIYVSSQSGQRVLFGAKRLMTKLNEAGYDVKLTVLDYKGKLPKGKSAVVIGTNTDKVLANLFPLDLKNKARSAGKEGFTTAYDKDGTLFLIGADNSGTLYSCIDLTEKIEANDQKIPTQLDFVDKPHMVLRGTCIGLQKPDYLPGRDVYEYPYTPESFPWFYDKNLWIKYLDMMVENRFNSLYLWNGHPFSSLVK